MVVVIVLLYVTSLDLELETLHLNSTLWYAVVTLLF